MGGADPAAHERAHTAGNRAADRVGGELQGFGQLEAVRSVRELGDVRASAVAVVHRHADATAVGDEANSHVGMAVSLEDRSLREFRGVKYVHILDLCRKDLSAVLSSDRRYFSKSSRDKGDDVFFIFSVEGRRHSGLQGPSRIGKIHIPLPAGRRGRWRPPTC